MTYCEDYPCCGHTPSDPCDGVSVITEPWFCDECGGYHYGGLYCPVADWGDEDDDYDSEWDEPFVMEDQWLDGSYEE